jgi:hypothetical protein
MATKPDIVSGNSSRSVMIGGGDVSRLDLAAPKRNSIRTLRTMLSDTDLEAGGLMVAKVPAGNVIDLSAVFNRVRDTRFLHEGWLMHHPVNHMTPPPGWLDSFDRRVDELREVAAEEELPFSESSATAARAFCEHHGRSIRPSIFLVGNGNVRLVWENDEGEQIGLQFRADRSRVQCILFKRREDGISTITVMETNSGLIQLLAGNRLLHLLGKR